MDFTKKEQNLRLGSGSVSPVENETRRKRRSHLSHSKCFITSNNRESRSLPLRVHSTRRNCEACGAKKVTSGGGDHEDVGGGDSNELGCTAREKRGRRGEKGLVGRSNAVHRTG